MQRKKTTAMKEPPAFALPFFLDLLLLIIVLCSFPLLLPQGWCQHPKEWTSLSTMMLSTINFEDSSTPLIWPIVYQGGAGATKKRVILFFFVFLFVSSSSNYCSSVYQEQGSTIQWSDHGNDEGETDGIKKRLVLLCYVFFLFCIFFLSFFSFFFFSTKGKSSSFLFPVYPVPLRHSGLVNAKAFLVSVPPPPPLGLIFPDRWHLPSQSQLGNSFP